jgi:hypothetical protein
MIEPTIRFPVACPECGREQLTEFPMNEVVDALDRGSDISLVATCHDVIWTATELELEQIQEYLIVAQGKLGQANRKKLEGLVDARVKRSIRS